MARSIFTVHTKKSFAIVEYVKDNGLFRVPDKLKGEPKPEIVGVG